MIILLVAVFTLLYPKCSAEEALILDALPIEDITQFASEQGVDLQTVLRSAISGEMDVEELFRSTLLQAWHSVIDDFRSVGLVLIAPMLAILSVRMTVPESSVARKSALLVCRVGCTAILAGIFADMRSSAETLMQLILRCSDLLTPVMVAAFTITGAETTALFLSPIAAMCTNLIQHVLVRWGISICAAAAVIAIAGNLSTAVRLKRLYELCRKTVHIGAGGLLSAFIAVLSIQGRLGAGRDSAAVRTAHYAVENILPIIGGNVSDSLDSLLSAAHLVKNALGAGACILIALISVIPMIRLLAMSFLLQLTSAVSEPLGDAPLTLMLSQTGGAIEMLLIVAASGAVLCGLLAGSCMSAASGIIR